MKAGLPSEGKKIPKAARAEKKAKSGEEGGNGDKKKGIWVCEKKQEHTIHDHPGDCISDPFFG